MEEIDRLLEGKMINGQRRVNRYGSKEFGHFGPFERSPLLPVFQNILDKIKNQINVENCGENVNFNFNQVEILKLSAGTRYYFDLDKEQETVGPHLFVNINGTNPITFYNSQQGVLINTTLSKNIVQENEQNNNNNNENGDKNGENNLTFASTSAIIAPEDNSCLILSPNSVKKYTRQIKAQSYKVKPIPVDLQKICSENNNDENITTSSLIYDFSLLLQTAKQKHAEKKAKRLEWLLSQQNSGKMSEAEVKEVLRKDGLKDAALEAEFLENGFDTEQNYQNVENCTKTDGIVKTRPEPNNSTEINTVANQYLLGLPTISYKRQNSYALIFRNFVKHTPLLTDVGSTQVNNSNCVNQGNGTSTTGSDTHVTEKQRQQYLSKQQKSNKLVPTLAIDLESMSEAELSLFEKKHVHSVYDNIADHFSGTRYQAWPQVDEFVQSLPPCTIMGDIGCGNGKYLSINPQITTIGCDISMNLLKLAHERGCNVSYGDGLSIPFKDNLFDNTISIAVLHHIASRKRRIDVINEMLRVTHPGGQVLITVWAREQDGSGGRVFTQGDVWVPFKTSSNVKEEIEKQKLQRQVLLEEKNKLVGRKEIFVEDKNIIQQKTIPETNIGENTSSIVIDAQLPGDVSEESTRFYHVFSQGELEDHVNDAGIKYPMKIERAFYGKGNWCIIFTKL
jgi:ubiquinone/menaquinone biosynthesis C-methylase UbiE